MKITNKPLLDPYKSIGIFSSGPSSLSQSSPLTLACCCNNSFKLYSEQLLIKMVSPTFGEKIRAIYTYNQCTYILVGNEVIKMKYQHLVRKWKIVTPITAKKNQAQNRGSLRVFEGVVIVSIGSHVYTIVENNDNRNKQQQEEDIMSLNLEMQIAQLVHPVTYINKLLAYSESSLVLFNPISQKILYSYSSLLSAYLSQSKTITKVCASPLIDIVAVCLSSGEILITNIRSSKILFPIKQKNKVSAIDFCKYNSYMITGDEKGTLILWDLENKKILYRLENAFQGPIDGLYFCSGELVVGLSALCNSVRQFRLNLDDSRTLAVFRERTGCPASSPLVSFKIQNLKQLTLSSSTTTTFTSLYSHSNTYSLPHCLASSLPYHVVGKNFTVQLYKSRSLVSKLNLSEPVLVSKISISQKFVIIGTKTRILKVAIPSNPTTVLTVVKEWPLAGVKDIVLNLQSYIYVLISDGGLRVFGFEDGVDIGILCHGQICASLSSNSGQTMLALENKTAKSLQIYNMATLSLTREFALSSSTETHCICFTPDNKHLLSSHNSSEHFYLSIYSIIDSCLYKTLKINDMIICMEFTSDAGYFVTLFQNSNQLSLWGNYIGKVVGDGLQEGTVLRFVTSIGELVPDYREELNKKVSIEAVVQNKQDNFDNLLQNLPDSSEPVLYKFSENSKWQPLLYYDEIKQRNTINSSTPQASSISMPFFLDFKNISEQQKKISAQMKKEVLQKKIKEKEEVDRLLVNEMHQIQLGEGAKAADYWTTYHMLEGLSVAEVDYQIRKYLIKPGNLKYLLKMLTTIISSTPKKQKSVDHSVNQMIVNILVCRILELAGSELLSEETQTSALKLLEIIKQKLKTQEDVVLRCMAVCEANM